MGPASVRPAVLVDFGSTFTKVRVVDLRDGSLLASGQAATTTDTALEDGYAAARRSLDPPWDTARPELVKATSSAGGGLRMIAIGLTPSLTVEAARRAALGAGARLIATYSYELTTADVAEICALEPGIVLLAGGADGGNRTAVVHNAGLLAGSAYTGTVILAGNRNAADEAAALLAAAGKGCAVTANVMPRVGELVVAGCRDAIRREFVRRITASHLFRDAAFPVRMPTPMAVLKGLAVVSDGIAGVEPGLGTVLAVDIGGATTDVHSVGAATRRAGVVYTGLEEPHGKRTVEGDLGLRSNATGIVARVAEDPGLATRCGIDDLDRLTAASRQLAAHRSTVPATADQYTVDAQLATAATALAVGRHVGHLTVQHGVTGPVRIQEGKDMRESAGLIGTGGVFRHAADPESILKGGVADERWPSSLRPVSPKFYVDREYCLFAAGLLADDHPHAAFALASRGLEAL
ncbi:glutamate mutase L [Actinophytocola sp.]|uniref:glutamate mutase L n=1 Tax=Actinophytocola sp. TaxID=1872138 RepID=UPI003D6A865A